MAMRKGIGGHQSATMRTCQWLTPPEIVRALGPFDLDPCFSDPRPWDTAAEHYSEGGLERPWRGRVWLNPPYGQEVWNWLARLAEHGDGIAIVFARTETRGFFEWVWERATGILFVAGRLHFYRPNGIQADMNAGGPSALVAYGERNFEVLRSSGIPGKLIRLRKD
jgi:hypothetical protein